MIDLVSKYTRILTPSGRVSRIDSEVSRNTPGAVQLDSRLKGRTLCRTAERTPAFRSPAVFSFVSPFVLNGPPSGHCHYCLRPASREHARFRRREAGRATMSGRAGYMPGRQRRYNERRIL